MPATPWDDRPSPAQETLDWHHEAAARDEARLAEGPDDDTETTDPWTAPLSGIEVRNPTPAGDPIDAALTELRARLDPTAHTAWLQLMDRARMLGTLAGGKASEACNLICDAHSLGLAAGQRAASAAAGPGSLPRAQEPAAYRPLHRGGHAWYLHSCSHIEAWPIDTALVGPISDQGCDACESPPDGFPGSHGSWQPLYVAADPPTVAATAPTAPAEGDGNHPTPADAQRPSEAAVLAVVADTDTRDKWATPQQVSAVDATFPPHGCRHCGVERRDHARRYRPAPAWHTWTEPTREQVTARVRSRREARRRTR
jgi:hypothetical protein